MAHVWYKVARPTEARYPTRYPARYPRPLSRY